MPENESIDEESPWTKEYWNPLATTHVANASAHSIWVSCETDPREVAKIKDDLRTVLREDVKTSNLIGFTKIEAKRFLAFNPSISPSPECRVYVTILVEVDGSPEIVASAYPLWPNHSVLVSRGRELRRVQLGKLWVDQEGVNHQ